MELSQKLQLKRTLIPQLTQSLNILALPLLEIKELIDKELESNPLLEHLEPPTPLLKTPSPSPWDNFNSTLDLRSSLITKKVSLQEILLRQLGMFTNTDEDFSIGQEIIGNIDENGYLKTPLDEFFAG